MPSDGDAVQGTVHHAGNPYYADRPRNPRLPHPRPSASSRAVLPGDVRRLGLQAGVAEQAGRPLLPNRLVVKSQCRLGECVDVSHLWKKAEHVLGDQPGVASACPVRLVFVFYLENT